MDTVTNRSEIEEVRSQFPGLESVLHFNTASHAAGCKAVSDAYKKALDDWVGCRLRWQETERAASAARASFARFINAAPESVALIPFVSTCAGVVAAQLPPARTGENIIVPDYEFSSNYYPWLLLRGRGYEVRRLSPENGAVTAEAFANAADAGTRLIAVSAVQATTGYRIDLAAVSQVARRSDAWFYVDGAQAVGAVDVDVVRDGIDFLAVSSHKYLLGTRGCGYLYVRPALIPAMTPILAGWRAGSDPLKSLFGPEMSLSETASKLDTSLAWFPILGEPHALATLERFGFARVLERNRILVQHLYERLEEHGLLAYRLPESARSPIAALEVPDVDGCAAHLDAAGVAVGRRFGRLRISLHYYNTRTEIDRLVALIDGYVRGKRR